MSSAKSKGQGEREYREMTVALLRERKDLRAVEVAFSESARFYRLSKVNSQFARIWKELRKAKETKRSVRVLMESRNGSVIEDVKAGS